MFERDELIELAGLLKDRKVSVAGRTLWLGGTDKSRKREASQFNCSFKRVETVHDAVDLFWLLLQGCGTDRFLSDVLSDLHYGAFRKR